MLLTDGTSRFVRRGNSGWFAAIAPVLCAAAWLPLVIGLFLVSRRMSGALVSSLPGLPLASTALALLAWATALRCIINRPISELPESVRSHVDRCQLPRQAKWLPAAAMLLFVVACSYPFNRIIDWIIWVPALAVEYWSGRQFAPQAINPQRSDAGGMRSVDPESFEAVQQLTRVRDADGSEAIRATLLAEFSTGVRSTTLHVAFCPPFERLPTIDAHVADDWPADVKVTQRLHQGAQLEVRLTEPAEEDVKIHVEMCAAEANSD